LFGSDVDLHEAKVYGHTVDRGGSVVTLRAPDTLVDKAVALLHTHNPVDVNQRAASLGIIAAAAAPLAAKAAAGARAVADTASSVTAKAPAAASMPTGNQDEVLRLAEETFNVGKRQVQAGMTRVRRFVTERPVEAQVTLHEEHAEIARRAISDPGYIKDIDWSDRTIEVRETKEQAVVSKSARIAEEVVIQKKGSDRVETVKDSVRRQQAEIERVDQDEKKKP